MKKNLTLLVGFSSLVAALVVGVFASGNFSSPFKSIANGSGEWHHYSKTDPTSSNKGVREYWVQCNGSYQFSAPDGVEIIDKGTAYDLSEFTANDDRYISYSYDEDHLSLSEYNYGAGMYCTNLSDFKNWRATYGNDYFNCNLYSEGGTYLWRIDLPRIDYTRYPTVRMNLSAPNWYENNHMGPEADNLPYHTVYGGNKGNGKINLTLGPTGLYMEVIDMEYGSAVAFTNTFTDSDILHGLKSAYFYTEDLYDRYLNISDITLSTESSKVVVYDFAGDTSKLSVVNGAVGLPESTDYSIVNNHYGNNSNSLVVNGNANPGAMVMTLPAFNFNEYTPYGSVSFTFGVKNNGEHMYFGEKGSGNEVDLGTNSPSSESNNNSGYVNWVLTVTSTGAHITNVYEGTTINVTLTAAMLNGTASVVISGNTTSVYRVYFVTNFYFQA